MTQKKIAFIHYAKAAGRYINYYLQQHVFENRCDTLAEQQVKAFNSWIAPFILGRDWTEEELLQLASNRHPSQYPTPTEIRTHHQCWSHDYLSHQYVHNHHCNWTRTSVEAFRSNGWLTFMFIREPSELLCSLWTWAQETTAAHNSSISAIKPAWLAELSLDSFIQEMLKSQEFAIFYALPDYVDEIEYVAEFTEKNFRQFLQDHFSHCYHPEITTPEQRFASSNPGYNSYRSQGLISEKSHGLLNNHPEVRRVRERFTRS